MDLVLSELVDKLGGVVLKDIGGRIIQVKVTPYLDLSQIVVIVEIDAFGIMVNIADVDACQTCHVNAEPFNSSHVADIDFGHIVD